MLKRYISLPQLFLINFVLLLGGILAIASLVIYYTLRQIEITQFTNQLKSEIAFIRVRMDEGESLEEATKEMSKIMGRHLRVTLIKMDGTVLFDNEADPRKMGDHANRPEVMMARHTGFATAVRYSKTVKNDRIYVAKKIIFNGNPVILRLSLSLDTVMQDFATLWVRIAAVFVVALLLGFGMSFLMRWRIADEIGKLTNYLQAINEKRYRAPFDAGFSHEFTTIASMLKRLAKRLEKSEKRKRKYNAKLRLINKQRSDMISAMSHEFKNPIAAIRGYAETLIDDETLSIQIRKRFLERIDQNAARMSTMIDRLSFIARMESSEIDPQKVRFDLFKTTQEAIEMMRQKYRERTINLEGESIYVYADETMLQMVVINLLDNALKYSEDAVTVRIDREKLCVEDRGMGVPAKEIDRITKKFYRLDKHRWDNSMGLGLAIVQYIVKLHQSRLMIHSEVGVGTTVYIDLVPINDQKK